MHGLAAAVVACCFGATGIVDAGTIAYQIPAGTAGNQGFGTGLGHDFDVGGAPITITSLGVFDDASDGIGANVTLTAQLFERDAADNTIGTLVSGAHLTFTNADPGTLVGGHRLKALDTPITLPSGGIYSIVAYGFVASPVPPADPTTDQNGNAGDFAVQEFGTTDDGGGAITFVGTARFGLGGVGTFPSRPDTGDVNRYGAGTFEFDVIPEPTTLVLAALGLCGLIACGRRRRQR
ncbi:MAG: PEP-CTERM sorting domain-containing protein [Planctomycetes bacterium]|nr:PEP-CTERM sorting domain-containing protein [Planctomycetota bacterium]